MKKLALALLCMSMVSVVFAHCGSCGTGSAKKDRQEKKIEKKVSILEAFSLSNSDEKKILGIEEDYLLEKKELKEQYEAKVSAVLTEPQADLYLQRSGKKGCCARKNKK